MSQFIEMFKDKKTNGKIADLVDTDIKSVKKSFNKDDLIEYIDISSVNAKSRTLNETTQYIVSSAPSRAQQCVQNGDILVSTVRPINRNVAVVDRDLTNLVASTGFCVLRPKDGYREYLLAIVTSDKYTDKMCDIASGGLYPAVNNSDVLSYDIFIPDKDFLNRVTQIYRQADKSGFDGRKSQFIEMFGDFHNKVQIKDVCLVVSGKSIPTKLENIDGNNPYIKVADFNIPGNEKYITIAQRYVSDDSASYSKQIPEGSVIFAKNGAASMSNKKRLTKIRCCIDMNTMAVFPKNESILSDFLFATIEAMDVSSHVRQGAIPSISPKSIEDSYIAMPTMEEQYRYVSIAKHADKSGSVLQHMIAC